jgi:hypothetical protein
MSTFPINTLILRMFLTIFGQGRCIVNADSNSSAPSAFMSEADSSESELGVESWAAWIHRQIEMVKIPMVLYGNMYVTHGQNIPKNMVNIYQTHGQTSSTNMEKHRQHI